MHAGKTLFSQVMEFLPMYEFRKCVARYHGARNVLSVSCLDQFLSMAFAPLTFRERLRDIEACLRAMSGRLDHMGFRGHIARSTLADANEHRDGRLSADFAMIVLHRARELYLDDPFGVERANTVYALDATTIDRCVSLFPWAYFRTHKGAITLHTLLDLRGHIPSFIEITDGKVADVTLLDPRIPEPGAFYLIDRGSLDFERLDVFHQASACFIPRATSNTPSRRLSSPPVDRSTGLRCDQTIVLTVPQTAVTYPDNRRRVTFVDVETAQRLAVLTNNFEIPPLTVARLYKSRWKVERFFQWITQHLRSKTFFGASENAVKTQRWIAIATYVLIAIIRKPLKLQISLYTFLQILSVTMFENLPLRQAVAATDLIEKADEDENQLLLFRL